MDFGSNVYYVINKTDAAREKGILVELSGRYYRITQKAA
jgi:hypothetical protein